MGEGTKLLHVKVTVNQAKLVTTQQKEPRHDFLQFAL